MTFSVTRYSQNNTITNQQAKPQAALHKEDVVLDAARLQQLGLVNEQTDVTIASQLGPIQAAPNLANLNEYLDEKRWGEHTLRTVIKEIFSKIKTSCADYPILLGDELLWIIGWEFLSSAYLQLVRKRTPVQRLEDILSQESIELAQDACRKRPTTLTVRFSLNQEVALHELHSTLKELLGSSSVSEEIFTYKKEGTSFSSFYCESSVGGEQARIYFNFPTALTTRFAAYGDALQIRLREHIIQIEDNQHGNQWCVDTMLQKCRALSMGKNLSKTIFCYLRNGYEPEKSALEVLEKELFPNGQNRHDKLIDLLNKLNKKEHRLQDILLLTQLAHTLNHHSIVEPFLKEALADMPTSNDMWHAALLLLKTKQATYQEIEVVMQIFGLLAAQFQGNASLKVVLHHTKKSLVFCSRTQGAECNFVVPLRLQEALRAFSECTNLDRFASLVSAILAKPGFLRPSRHTLTIPCNTYLAKAIFGSLQEFTTCLKELPAHLAGTSNEYKHMVGRTMKLAVHARGMSVPEVLHNGGILSEHVTSNWCEWLLSQRLFQEGVDLLVQLEGEVDRKAKWATNFLANQDFGNAQRLIVQVVDEVTELQVKSWLAASRSTNSHQLLVTTLIQGKWAQITCLENPDFVMDAKGKICSRLFEAMNDEGPHRQEYVILLARTFLAPPAIKHYYERAERMLKALEDGTCSIPLAITKELRATRREFAASSRPTMTARYLKVFCSQFSEDDTFLLLDCLEKTLDIALLEWYLALPKEKCSFKFFPERRIRLYLQIVTKHPSLLAQEHGYHIQSLYQHVPQDAILESEILKAREVTEDHETFDALFLPFFRTEDVVEEEVEEEPAEVQELRSLLHAKALSSSEKNSLLTCLETCSLPIELVKEYLSLPETILPYKYEPARRVRLFLHLAKEHPELIAKEYCEHVSQLQRRLVGDTSLQADINQAKEHIENTKLFDELFKPFFPVKKVKAVQEKVQQVAKPAIASKKSKQQEVREKEQEERACRLLEAERWLKEEGDEASVTSCIEGLFKESNYDKAFALLAKYHTLPISLWKRPFIREPARAINFFQSHAKAMPALKVAEVWAIVLGTPAWQKELKEDQLFAGLNALANETTLERLLPALKLLPTLLEKYPQRQAKYLDLAYKWYRYIPDTDPQKITLGISLLKMLNENAKDKHITQAGDIVRILFEVKTKTTINASFDCLIPFARLSKTAKGKQVTPVVVSLINFIEQTKAAVAYTFAVEHFWDHPSLEVKEALWPIAITNVKKGHLETNLTGLSRALLAESSSVEILLKLFMREFVKDEANMYEHSGVIIYINPIPDFTAAFSRLSTLVLASKDPTVIERALVLYMHIRRSYPLQAQALEPLHPRYSDKVMLMQIQFNGWTENTVKLFTRYLGLYEIAKLSVAKPFKSLPCPGRTFSLTEENHSVCPIIADSQVPWPFTSSIMEFVQTAFDMAVKAPQSSPGQLRLLDFAIQTVRNLLDNRLLDRSIMAFLNGLAAHFSETSEQKNIVYALLKKTHHALGCPVDAQAVERTGKRVEDLDTEDLETLAAIKEKLLSAQDVTTLHDAHKALIAWQDSELLSSFAARQECIDLLLNAYKKQQIFLRENSVQRLLGILLSPNTTPVGIHHGERGFEALAASFKSYMDFYLEIYRALARGNPNGGYNSSIRIKGGERVEAIDYSDDGRLAKDLLNDMIKSISVISSTGALDTKPELFDNYASSIIDLLQRPCFVPIGEDVELLEIFTLTLLRNPCKNRYAVVHKWLGCIKRYEQDPVYETLFGESIEKIIGSNVYLEFSQEELETFVSCLRTQHKKEVARRVHTQLKTSKDALTSLQISCRLALLTLIHNSVYTRHKTKRTIQASDLPIAQNCLEGMVLAVRHGQTHRIYEGRVDIYTRHKEAILSRVSMPTLLGTQCLFQALNAFITADDILDVLMCMKTYKDHETFPLILTTMMPIIIQKNIIAKSNPTTILLLNGFVLEWQRVNPKLSKELILSFEKQLKERTMLAMIDAVEDQLTFLDLQEDK